MLALATELQTSHCLYAVGDLPRPLFDGLKKPSDGLDVFKHIRVSSELNERLSHSPFLVNALASTDFEPKRTLYLASHIDNVISARPFGLVPRHQTRRYQNPPTRPIRQNLQRAHRSSKRHSSKAVAGAFDLGNEPRHQLSRTPTCKAASSTFIRSVRNVELA